MTSLGITAFFIRLHYGSVDITHFVQTIDAIIKYEVNASKMELTWKQDVLHFDLNNVVIRRTRNMDNYVRFDKCNFEIPFYRFISFKFRPQNLMIDKLQAKLSTSSNSSTKSKFNIDKIYNYILTIEQVKIKDGTLLIKDSANNQQYNLIDLNLNMNKIHDLGVQTDLDFVLKDKDYISKKNHVNVYITNSKLPHKKNKYITIKGHYKISKIPITMLKLLFTKRILKNTMAWLKPRTSGGMISNGLLNYEIQLSQNKKSNIIDLKDVSGQFKLENNQFRVITELEKVNIKKANVNFNLKKVEIDIKSATFADNKITKAKIVLMNLDQPKVKQYASAQINGSGESWRIMQNLYKADWTPDIIEFKGQGSYNLRLRFPIKPKLIISDFKINMDANIKNCKVTRLTAIDNAIGSSDNVKLKIKDNVVNLTTGANTLLKGHKMVINFITYLNRFAPDQRQKKQLISKLTIKNKSNITALADFDYEEIANYCSGISEGQMIYEIYNDKSGKLYLDYDITDTQINFPYIKFFKPKKQPANIKLLFNFMDGDMINMESLNLSAKDQIQIKGEGDYDGSFWKKLTLKGNYNFYDKLKIKIVSKRKNNYFVNLNSSSGNIISVIKFAQRGNKPNSKYSKMNFDVHFAVDKIYNTHRMIMKNMTGTIKLNQSIVNNLSVKANSVGDKDATDFIMKIRLKDSIQYIDVNLYNLTDIIGSFEWARAVKAGSTELQCERLMAKNKEKDWVGSFIIKDVDLGDAIIDDEKLLEIDETNSEKIKSQKIIAKLKKDYKFKFNTAKGSFSYNPKELMLARTLMQGREEAIVIEGKMNFTHNNKADMNVDVAMKGTILPSYQANKIIGNTIGQIPIIGWVFGVKNKGVFALNFSIDGPIENPNFNVNPLSVLPGFLRDLVSADNYEQTNN